MAEVDIINMAFSEIGESPITSVEWALGASGTLPKTQKAYAIYSKVRDSVLRSHYWNCCIKYAEIMEDTTADPIHTYSHQYSLPNDYIRIVDVMPREDEITYKIAGQKLLTDEASGPDQWTVGTYYPLDKYVSYNSVTYKCKSAHTGSATYLPDEVSSTKWTSQSGDYDVLDIIYVYQNTDDTKWDALLKEVIATRLAIKLAITIGGDQNIYQRLMQYYTQILLPQAKTIDAQEETPDKILTQTWISEME
jgi:hypothetical protein